MHLADDLDVPRSCLKRFVFRAWRVEVSKARRKRKGQGYFFRRAPFRFAAAANGGRGVFVLADLISPYTTSTSAEVRSV